MSAEPLDNYCIRDPRGHEEDADSRETRVVSDAIRKLYRFLDDGIESIGGIAAAAGVCVIDRSDLRKGIDRANGRRGVAVDDVLRLSARITRFNRSLATRIGAALVDPMDLLVFPQVTLKPEDENVLLKAKLRAVAAAFGVDGEQMISDALGGRR